MSQINYRNQETVKDAFFHSCLGKLTILGGILVLILAIAYFTNPTEQEMAVEMEDNVMQCLEENDSIQGDKIDDYVNNLGHTFTKADTTKIFPDLIQSSSGYPRWHWRLWHGVPDRHLRRHSSQCRTYA